MKSGNRAMRARLMLLLLFVYLVAAVQAAFLAATKDRGVGNRSNLRVATTTTAAAVRTRHEQCGRNPFPSSTILFADNNNDNDTNENQRRPWDVVRFVRQSSRFVSLFPGSGTKKPSRAEDRRGRIAPGTILWKAGDGPRNDFEFAPLDDVVMGGASVSRFDTATGKWTGTVTDANNGGFIGIRSTPLVEYDLSACGGIEWTLAFAGNAGRTNNNQQQQQQQQSPAPRGARLKVVLRDSADFNGIGWTTSRDATNAPSSSSGTKPLVTLKIPFDGNGDQSLVPSRFAKILTDAPPFASSSVKAIQLTYSKFEYDGGLNPKFYIGDFSMQLLEIRTY